MKYNYYNSSAIAEMAHIFLLDPDHGIVRNPILDANNVDFDGTTTPQCHSLNPAVGCYGTRNHESKVRRYGTLARIHFFVPKRPLLGSD